MYLSKLELHGFKSFADRTVVDFSDGVTVVVGPNGCGKSNIVDAVRWVIGEQRARILRSDKMDSVIFNGTSKRRSLGMAEVLLTVENTRGVLPTEYSEVTIGRRLFRSGESEYLLNGVNCRLKDITDLFMDTGMGAGAYSVIELKMIEEILSDNAQDRRHLFEEAAGITKYKIRRGQTLRKLKSTQGDLNRVRDLTEELDKQVRSLERQAQKASRFKRYEERLHQLDLMLASLEYQKLSSDAQSVKKEIVLFSDSAAGFSTKLSAEEASHESLRTDHISREKLVLEAQTKLAEHMESLRTSESDLRLGTERLTTISRDLTRLEEERTAAVGQKKHLKELLERSESEQTDVLPAAEKAESELTNAKRIKDEAQLTQQKHQVMLHNLRLEERGAVSSKMEEQRLIDRLSSRVEIVTTDIADTEAALAAFDASSSDISSRKSASESELKEAAKQHEKATTKLSTAVEERKQIELDLQGSQISLRAAERAHDAAAAEVSLLQGLLSSFDDFDEPVQFLATESNWSSADLTTVADLISCDNDLQVAVNAALGDYASCIVVKTADEARRAVQSLRSSEKGQATFLVMERLKKAVEQFPAAEYTRLASLVRSSESEYEALVDLLFSGCYLVDSLDGLSGELPGRMITRTGEWVDPSGYLHAGSETRGESASSSRMGRREKLDAAEATLSEAQVQLQNAEAAHSALSDKLVALPVDSLRQKLGAATAALTEAEKHASRVAYESEVAGGRRTETLARILTLSDNRKDAEEKLAAAGSAVKSLTVKVADLQNKRADAEAAFSGIEEASREAFSLFNEANITAVQTRNRLDNLKREIARTQEEITAIETRAARRVEAIEEFIAQRGILEIRCSELQVSIRTMQDARSDLDKAVSAAKESLMETKVAISELEARLREIRRDRESAMKSESDRAVRQAEIETRLEDLLAGFEEDYQIDLATHEVEIEEGFDRATAKEEVQTLRNRIRHLGPVNALALDSFEEEKERLRFMKEQLDDLEKAESTLMATIEEINTTASRRFDETFEAIRGNFQKLFVELFGEEASADIQLENKADPLESDILIMAKPRGKKPSVLAQLSGGEKTLTAIAMLFAIYLVKPSPFCILDEVDAPLDDANVDRFMHLIRTFSESTQFIVVTHNKRTMEAADRLYGITMQEQGISKLVGVRFEEELEGDLMEAGDVLDQN